MSCKFYYYGSVLVHVKTIYYRYSDIVATSKLNTSTMPAECLERGANQPAMISGTKPRWKQGQWSPVLLERRCLNGLYMRGQPTMTKTINGSYA